MCGGGGGTLGVGEELYESIVMCVYRLLQGKIASRPMEYSTINTFWFVHCELSSLRLHVPVNTGLSGESK